MASDDCKDACPAAGEICWLEVPCTDIDRALSFYSAVLGWESANPEGCPSPLPGPMEGTDAVHMFRRGRMHGAFVKMSSPDGVAAVVDAAHPAKAPVLASYNVSSIEETLAKVEAAGGRVHVPKTAIAGGSMGYFARFVDTEGNLQGIWEAPAN
ncbi:b74375f8-e0a9-43bc-ad4c-6d87b52f8971 [Thermothielavioides terrestris]|uniref:B74375f8-e0a9-43bc-ad4c-6d87b52f8971 n=1 Tax=Thermothielavioides terrestris TaxID=2587410 RepID=A0A3S5CXQ9_9PEZI|nr:b74375f8-e0a9-43bc-ad4c-6d87b52f8971 [Thermothielavioides terrestris]